MFDSYKNVLLHIIFISLCVLVAAALVFIVVSALRWLWFYPF